MKLVRYYGKARNFNSIGCVKKRENSDKNSFFNLCNAAFTMIFFTLGMAPQSISSQYYGKTAFFLSGTFTLHTYLKFEASFWISRNSRPECSVKTVFLEISHTTKHLCLRLFFNKAASRGLQKRGSGTSVFPWILRNF